MCTSRSSFAILQLSTCFSRVIEILLPDPLQIIWILIIRSSSNLEFSMLIVWCINDLIKTTLSRMSTDKLFVSSNLEVSRVTVMPRDRVAEQGDVDGSLECSVALGMVATEVRLHVTVQQVTRTLFGSVRTTQWMTNNFKLKKIARCGEPKTFGSEVQQNSLELTTRKKHEN